MTAPSPFTERMNELIAWAEEQVETWRVAADVSFDGPNHHLCKGRSNAFREVANHLRQLSQGAKTDEG